MRADSSSGMGHSCMDCSSAVWGPMLDCIHSTKINDTQPCCKVHYNGNSVLLIPRIAIPHAYAYTFSFHPGKICAVSYLESPLTTPFVRCHFCFANVHSALKKRETTAMSTLSGEKELGADLPWWERRSRISRTSSAWRPHVGARVILSRWRVGYRYVG